MSEAEAKAKKEAFLKKRQKKYLEILKAVKARYEKDFMAMLGAACKGQTKYKGEVIPSSIRDRGASMAEAFEIESTHLAQAQLKDWVRDEKANDTADAEAEAERVAVEEHSAKLKEAEDFINTEAEKIKAKADARADSGDEGESKAEPLVLTK